MHDATDCARAAVVGLTITGVLFEHDHVEVHMGDVILTGLTKPFGVMGCQGVGPNSLVQLIGRRVDDLSVVADQFVALDSGENRLAFPIGGPTATGPESVRLLKPAELELGTPQALWVW